MKMLPKTWTRADNLPPNIAHNGRVLYPAGQQNRRVNTFIFDRNLLFEGAKTLIWPKTDQVAGNSDIT